MNYHGIFYGELEYEIDSFYKETLNTILTYSFEKNKISWSEKKIEWAGTWTRGAHFEDILFFIDKYGEIKKLEAVCFETGAEETDCIKLSWKNGIILEYKTNEKYEKNTKTNSDEPYYSKVHLSKEEKRKILIGDKLLPLFEPFMLKTDELVVKKENNTWVSPCTECIHRVRNITNGCHPCEPKKK